MPSDPTGILITSQGVLTALTEAILRAWAAELGLALALAALVLLRAARR